MWLCGNPKSNEIRKATARLINTSFSLQSDYPEQAGVNEKRGESRITRIMPVAVFLGDNSESSIFVGFTRDLSLEGMALLTTREVPLSEFLVVVGDRDHRTALRVQCMQSRSIGFGCYQSGLKITEVLRGAKYSPLLDYVAFLETAKGHFAAP